MNDPVKETSQKPKLGSPVSQGIAWPGRPKGVPNKTTTLWKDAIMIAAEQAGKDLDPSAEDGLTAYLKDLAETNKPAFALLMGKVFPLQINAEHSGQSGSIQFLTIYETKPSALGDDR